MIKKIILWFKWHLYYKWEMRRCKRDPHYMYTKYYLVDGKLATTRYTKKEFNEIMAKAKDYVPQRHRRRGLNNGLTHTSIYFDEAPKFIQPNTK